MRPSSKVMLIQVFAFVLFVSDDAFAQTKPALKPVADQRSAIEQIKNKARMGIIDLKRVYDERQTQKPVPPGNPNAMASDTIRWNTETLPLITNALDQYLTRYNVVLKQQKYDTILSHIDNYTAFKTSLFTNHEPSEEVGKIIAGQIARGIRWANRDDVQYPSEDLRLIAKSQIQEVFEAIQQTMIDQISDSQFIVIVDTHIKMAIDGYSWRVDSPFFVHGKRVFPPPKFQSLIEECLERCHEEFNPTELQSTEKYIQASEDIKKFYLSNLTWDTIMQSSNPLINAYMEGANRAPSKEENDEARQLLTTLRQKEQQTKP